MSPVRRRSGLVRSASSRRRKVVWATANITNSSVGANTSVTPVDMLSGLEAAGVGITGGTVMRTHFFFGLSCLETDTGPGAIFGLIVWDKTTVAAGTPQVSNDFYADWVFQSTIGPGGSKSAVALPATPTTILYGDRFDIKARRRLHNMNDSYFWCLHNVGSASLSYSVFAKTLIALP